MVNYPNKKLDQLKAFLNKDSFERTNSFASTVAVVFSRLNTMIIDASEKRAIFDKMWKALNEKDRKELEAEFEKQNIRSA
jgi:hypothetical protein